LPASSARWGDHPFASFVRTVGRGATLSRSLSGEEAGEAMDMILSGDVEPEQLGAFLVVLRYRKESPAELAGFVKAARKHLSAPADLGVDLDWPSYADRHRQMPYFVLAALLLARNGIRTCLHGIAGIGPVTTPAALRALGLAPATSFTAAKRALAADNFAYLPIETLCPALGRLFTLRPILGVRSPANTFARELNPLAAPCQVQGVFHPTYLPTHLETARILGQPRAAIFKGGGGEVQCNPEKPCRVMTLENGRGGEETWPALAGERHPWRAEPLEPARLVALWRGDDQAPGPEAAIVGTASIALKLLGRASTQGEALSLAKGWWAERPRSAYG
jgi:anthranilate phosphoribosyltransferase